MMTRMSDMSEQALMELLRRPRRTLPVGPAPATAPAAGANAVPDGFATCLSAEDGEAPRGCDDLYAPRDLAALQEGHLSPDGIQRFARHVARCKTCKILVATIVAEVNRAESTGMHAVMPERDRQRK